MQCNWINCHHQLLLNLAIELHTKSSQLDQGTPEVEAHARLLPQAKATYLRNTLFHRLYLKVIAITFPTSHKTSLFSLTYFPRIQLTIEKINNKDLIIFTIYFNLVCLRTLHSFQEKRGTNQSLNLIISGPDSNMCGDYKPLNLVTPQDSYPMPILEKLFDSIGDSNIFTIVDMR